MNTIRLFSILAELANLVKASASQSVLKTMEIVDARGETRQIIVAGLMGLSVMEWEVAVEKQLVLEVWSESQDGKKVGKIRFYIKGLEILGFEYDEMVELMHFVEKYTVGEDVLTLCLEIPPTPEMIRREFWDVLGGDLAGPLVAIPTPTYNKLYRAHLQDPVNHPDPFKTPLTPQEEADQLFPGFVESWETGKAQPAIPEYFTSWYMANKCGY